jgi:hypothetical protein
MSSGRSPDAVGVMGQSSWNVETNPPFQRSIPTGEARVDHDEVTRPEPVGRDDSR